MSANANRTNRGSTILRAGPPGVVAAAAAALQAGEVVAIPTDTVYGLAAAINRPAAINRLFSLKGREASKAIPVLLSDLSEIGQVASAWPPLATELASAFWPGALTLIVPARGDLPIGLTAEAADGVATIAIRVPDHQLARELISAAGGALAVTSANLAGERPALDAAQVAELRIGSPLLIIDDGPAPGGVASTVVSVVASEPTVVREGAIAANEIMAATGQRVAGRWSRARTRSSRGMIRQ